MPPQLVIRDVSTSAPGTKTFMLSEIYTMRRSGRTNLNSELSGNSGHDAGPRKVWRKGVFDGQEEKKSMVAKKQRRKLTAEIKACVAITALREDKAIAEWIIGKTQLSAVGISV